MKDCLFCNLNKLTQEAVQEQHELFKVILDPFPVSFGHKTIVPQRHVEKIDDLNVKELKRLQKRISEAKSRAGDIEAIEDNYSEIMEKGESGKSEEMIKSIQGVRDTPDGFNIGINEGEAAGQTVDHLHIHLIPRYEGDVENPKGGVRNVVNGRADYTGEKE